MNIYILLIESKTAVLVAVLKMMLISVILSLLHDDAFCLQCVFLSFRQ